MCAENSSKCSENIRLQFFSFKSGSIPRKKMVKKCLKNVIVAAEFNLMLINSKI